MKKARNQPSINIGNKMKQMKEYRWVNRRIFAFFKK